MSCSHNLNNIPSLGEVLKKNNETCGHDIYVSSGDKITSDCLVLESKNDANIVVGGNRANYINGTEYTKADKLSFDVECLSLSSSSLMELDSAGKIKLTAHEKLDIVAPVTHVSGDLHISGNIIMDTYSESGEKSSVKLPISSLHQSLSSLESLNLPIISSYQSSLSQSSSSLPIISSYGSKTSLSSESCSKSCDESQPEIPFQSISQSEDCHTDIPAPPPIPHKAIGVMQFGELQDYTSKGCQSMACQNWTIRPLNFATSRNITFDLKNNEITFREMGVYSISGWSSFYSPDGSVISTTKFSSITSTAKDEIRTVLGSNVYGSGNSLIDGIFTVSIPNTTFALQYRTSHNQSSGLGRPNGFTSNIYASFVVTKLQ